MMLTGKKALVTASSKGIGYAVADKLLGMGAEVFISSSNSGNIEQASARLSDKHKRLVEYFVCDLRNAEEVRKLFAKVSAVSGSPDILINNCGGPPSGYFEDFSEDAWESAYREILYNAASLVKYSLPGMKEKRWGRVVNITSIAVFEYIENLILSATFRTALTTFSKILARQVAPFGITINNVAPGYTLTGRILSLAEKRSAEAGISAEKYLEEMQERVPMKRFARPDEIASAAAYFCGAEAGYVTGNSLVVDGGLIQSL